MIYLDASVRARHDRGASRRRYAILRRLHAGHANRANHLAVLQQRQAALQRTCRRSCQQAQAKAAGAKRLLEHLGRSFEFHRTLGFGLSHSDAADLRLMPHLAARSAQWPGITLDLAGEVRTASLHRREADFSVRFMRPSEPGLAARKLGELSFRLYAAAAWLNRPESAWRFLGYSEPLHEVPHQKWLSALHKACSAGLGLAILPIFLARSDTALIEIPAAGLPLMREIWGVVHPDVRHSPLVRLIADLVAELLAAEAKALI